MKLKINAFVAIAFMVIWFPNGTVCAPKKKPPPNTTTYIVQLHDDYRVKSLIGFDVLGDGSMVIERQHIERLFGAKNNLPKKEKRLKKKLKNTTDPKKKARLTKRLKRVQKNIKAHNKLEKRGKLKYKNKTFVLHINTNIPTEIAIEKLNGHPAIRSATKTRKLKPMGSTYPDDPMIDATASQTVKIRKKNTQGSLVEIYGSNELPKLWYLDTIGMKEVWENFPEVTGEDVVVAVIDSGIQLNHEDIQGNIWVNPNKDDTFDSLIRNDSPYFTNPNVYQNDTHGWNYVDNNYNVSDDNNGHGSHVAGTIAAVGDNTKGLIGIAPKSNIMVLKVYHDGAGNSGEEQFILSALDYAINNNAHVINMSLGSSVRIDLNHDVMNLYSDLFEEAQAKDIVIAIAAGNSRSEFEETNYEYPGEIFSPTNEQPPKAYYPAWLSVKHDNVLTVSATTWARSSLKGGELRKKNSDEKFEITVDDLDEHLAYFSNYSTRHTELASPTRNPITVAAPGTNIFSIKKSNETNGYVSKNGTSMATPIVSGLAALLFGINPNFTAKEVVDLIKSNTVTTAGTDLSNSDYVGAGRINAFQTIVAAYNSSISIDALASSIITEPTFEISGATTKNATVDIIQIIDTQKEPLQTITADADGTFTTTITPRPDQYNTPVVELVASTSITIDGELRQIESKPLRLRYTIADVMPKLNEIDEVIVSPTITIVGRALTGIDINLVEHNDTGESIVSSVPTRGNTIGNADTVTFNVTSHRSSGMANRKLSLRDQFGRSSAPVTITTNKHQPTLTTPNVMITSPFYLTGTASANAVTQIFACETKDCTIKTFIVDAHTDHHGNFNVPIHYFDFGLSNHQAFIASATVQISDSDDLLTGQKASPVMVALFQIPDTRARIISPANNGIITSDSFKLRGFTTSNITVTLNQNDTFIGSTQSNADGYFEFTVPSMEGSDVMYQAVSTVYEKEYPSHTIKLNFSKNDQSPVILYPTDNDTIESGTLTIRGTMPPNGTGLLMRRSEVYKHLVTAPTLISHLPIQIKSNEDGFWSHTIRALKPDQTLYYAIKTSVDDEWLYSNDIRFTAIPNTNTPIILQPSNYDHVDTAFVVAKGISQPNRKIQLSIFSDESLTTPVKTSVTKADRRGRWSTNIPSPPNAELYYLTATDTDENATSNSVAFRLDYDFNKVTLSIDSHNDGVTTNKKAITLSGTSPNGEITFTLHKGDTLMKEWTDTVLNNKWQTDTELKLDQGAYLGTFVFEANITHNTTPTEVSTQTKSITIGRDRRPKITTKKQQALASKTLRLSGTASEKTLLTLTKTERSLNPQQSLGASNVNSSEIILGTVLTDSNGEWELDVPINYSGNYKFKVYENYLEANQQHEEVVIDVQLNDTSINFAVGPSPYNPTKGPLYIEYSLNEPADVEIAVYSISGSQRHRISKPNQSVGRHVVTWHAPKEQLLPGLYIVLFNVTVPSSHLK
ncbi:MAG: S8 family serine peptidase [Candidatus Margulisbacteria bacterium]|nr:S8 family serine peptidase [Candidatus Margulisiibacteriota bacterium]